jgi:two-component system, OmpR family, phosphate regulon sensor histidine kinase PhoR
MRQKLLWQLYPSYLLVVLLCIILVILYSAQTIRKSYLNRSVEDLEAQGRLIEAIISEVSGDRLTNQQIDQLCSRMADITGIQVAVFDSEANMIGNSLPKPFSDQTPSGRPEVRSALAGRTGQAIRYSTTSRRNILHVAVPAQTPAGAPLVIRTSLPLSTIGDSLSSLWGRILFGSVVIALVVTVVSYFISRRISHPIEELKRGADRFAAGQLDTRLPIPDSEEIGSLAISMNRMAAQLGERIQTVERQRNELQTVLSSMVEGVIVVDSEERISRINQAGAELLGISQENSIGRSILEVVRNHDLHILLSRTLDSDLPVENEILLYDPEERFLQAHGTQLRDADGQRTSALIVLNDVTALRKLESVRRQFVANVSHELKTPITSIKGFVETLLEGAMQEPEEAHRFLQIISRHADRLGAIIEDLLALSRVELNVEKDDIFLEEWPVRDVLSAAIQDCEIKARERAMSIQLECEPEIRIRMNPPLIEQAASNLIDNAIKYSDPGQVIAVSGIRRNGQLEISVRDQGWGIAEEHLGRIFERFYRVDKGRSRKQGGTGLGLAIVKHIAQAHRGQVEVQSRLGEGSTFYIRLPLT